MPRRERVLDAGDGPLVQFAAGLRRLREAAGCPGYRQLARRAHFSSTTLSDAAGGRRLPSLAVTLAYVRACGGDVAEWEKRWRATAAQLASESASEFASESASDSASESTSASASEPTVAGDGGGAVTVFAGDRVSSPYPGLAASSTTFTAVIPKPWPSIRTAERWPPHTPTPPSTSGTSTMLTNQSSLPATPQTRSRWRFGPALNNSPSVEPTAHSKSGTPPHNRGAPSSMALPRQPRCRSAQTVDTWPPPPPMAPSPSGTPPPERAGPTSPAPPPTPRTRHRRPSR